MDKNVHKSGDPSTMTVKSEREIWIRVYIKAGRKACQDGDIIIIGAVEVLRGEENSPFQNDFQNDFQMGK